MWTFLFCELNFMPHYAADKKQNKYQKKDCDQYSETDTSW